jgi:cytochrome c oxidase subunit 2
MSPARRLGAICAAALLAACGAEYPQSSLDPRTDFAQVIHGLYTSVFWWTMVILAVVWLLLAYVVVRFRERPGAPEPRQSHGHLGMEIGWTIGPAIVVVAIAVPTIQAVFATQRGDPENALVVEVIGHQFWWEFRYPDFGVVTANELHLPVGRPVSLRLHSADVIHSFWVPQLGGKRDLNPLVRRPEGELPRYNWLHFTIQEPGVYTGQCAEFCGLSHSLMGTRVMAVSEADFRTWVVEMAGPAPSDSAVAQPPDRVAGAVAPTDSTDAAAAAPSVAPGAVVLQQPGQTVVPPPDPVALGREVFHSSTCIACHAIQGTNAQGVLGPNLTLLGRRATIGAGWLENTPENLTRWITDPSSVKPGVLMPGIREAGGNWPPTNLTEEQVTAVAAYLSSLR